MDIIKYAKDLLPDLEGAVTVREIGDGNLNYVYRLTGGNKSYILKKAENYVRISERMMIPKNRVMFEALYVSTQENYIETYLPKLWHVNKELGIIIMEDLSDYTSLRSELLQYHVFDFFSDQITEILIKSLLCTSKYYIECII